MAGIEAIHLEKKKQHSIFPYMGVVSTVSNLNYLYLDKLADALRNKGLSWHIINLGTYISREIGESHEKWLKEKLEIIPKYWKGFNSGFNEGIDGARFSKVLMNIQKSGSPYPVITVPPIKTSKIGIYYSQLGSLVQEKCGAPWLSSNINYNGDVHFCADYPDYIIGNIMNDKLRNIYNNEKAIKFRRALKESPNGIFPGCSRCYQLMFCGRKYPGY